MSKFITCISTIIGVLFASLCIVGQVFAASGPLGTTWDDGYFTGSPNKDSACNSSGVCFSGDYVLPQIGGGLAIPLDTVSSPSSTNPLTSKQILNQQFIPFIEGLYNSNTGDATKDAWNKTGAAFIINTMLGNNAPGAGVAGTGALFSQWGTLLNNFVDNGGTIDWDATYSYSGAVGPDSGSCINSFDIKNHAGAGDSDPEDDAFENSCGSDSDVIIFHTIGNNAVYALKRRCGNPVGQMTGIPTLTQGTIQGYKVDTSGNAGGAFSGDKISAAGKSDTSNSYKLANIPVGNVTVTDDDASGVTLQGYAWCNSSPGCTPENSGPATGWQNYTAFTGSNWPKSGTGSFPAITAGEVINLYWIYAPSGGGGGTPLACPMQPKADVTAIVASMPTREPSDTQPSDPTDGQQYKTRTNQVPFITSVSVPYDSSITFSSSDYSTNTVNFSKLVAAYPYDSNNVQVTYQNSYTLNTYTYHASTKSWSEVSVPSAGSAPHTDGSASLGECYPRNFIVSSPTTSVGLENNTENPSSATTSNSVTVTFTLPDVTGGTKQVRSPMKIADGQLHYTTTYQIARNGSATCTVTLQTPTYAFPYIGDATTSGQSLTSPPQTEGIGVSVGNGSTQLEPGDRVCGSFTTQYSQGEVDEDGSIVSGSACSASSTACNTSAYSPPVVNEPYFKVFGGDVSAGDSFAVTSGVVAQCVSSAAAASASVYGWNTAGDSAYNPNQYIKNLPAYSDTTSPYYNVSSNLYAGAGAQFSIMAINNITGVASGQNNVNADDMPNNTQGNGLAFANASTNPSSGLFATGFGAAPACVPDYYADEPGTPPSLSGSIPATADGAYSLSGSTIAGGTIGAGKHVVVYATGNVNITGPITFAAGSYSVDDIPSFVLVVKGNINVSDGVTQLDGIYVAQPTDPATPTDGILSDCAEASADRTNLWSACANPLTVNGSFIANEVELLRTSTGDSGSHNENASIRAALAGESNSLSATVIEDANETLTCSSGVPDGSGMCPQDYNSGSSGTSGYYALPYDSGSPICLYVGDEAYSPPGTYYDSYGKDVSTSSTGSCGTDPVFHQPGHAGTRYNLTYYPGSSATPASCDGGETMSGSNCVPKSTYTYPPGCTPVPTDKSKCTIHVTPTHASEVFNYSPAFWLTLSLQNASSQNALKYDSVTSLPPVL